VKHADIDTPEASKATKRQSNPVYSVDERESISSLMKHQLISAGLTALQTSGLTRVAARWTRGLGAILMFHHVRPKSYRSFNPFDGLEITPEFLEAVILHLKGKGYDIIPMSAVKQRLLAPDPSKPFAVLTFDDGYRDNVEHALPILKKYHAPFTIYVTTGFADGVSPLWWLDMADAVASGATMRVGDQVFAAKTKTERFAAHTALYQLYLRQPGLKQAGFVQDILTQCGITEGNWTKELCLDWEALRSLSQEPLCTIGAHTLTHPLLAKMPAEVARDEMARSKTILEERLGVAIHHMAYPVGDPTAAGEREFTMAAEIGYETSVTTRPGVLVADHAALSQSLPRLSVNGLHQTIPAFDALLSGLPFFLMNKGKLRRKD
jgi:peptidoglycan/xylan/chitin deacetylase (PgdA/CDA1 family)